MWLGPNNYPGPNAYLGPDDSGGGGTTVANFNTRYGLLSSIAEFNAEWQTDVENQFQTQAFGNAPGARVLHEDAYYRIESAQYNPVTVSYSAKMDTIVSDFNAVWPGGSVVTDFNELFEGMLVRDFNTIPLWRGDN